MKPNVAVIILTYNEEANIAQALASVCDWAREVFILDSFSTDRTLEIAASFPCQIFQNKFVGYATQRNYALEKLPIQSEWVFFLDADEWPSEALKNEISALLPQNPRPNGFLIKRRFIWMGRWLKRGYYPVWILRLFRLQYGRCEAKEINEHIVVEGTTGQLQHDIIHEDQKDLTHWIDKHNRYSTMTALEQYNAERHPSDLMPAKFFGSKAERNRWLVINVYNRFPRLLRPFLFFFYRYFLRGGFLDGKEAFIYHFLQGLWLLFVVDVKYLELKTKGK